jgi:lipoprotein-anchoring transpeptidase ErfK/SrfK
VRRAPLLAALALAGCGGAASAAPQPDAEPDTPQTAAFTPERPRARAAAPRGVHPTAQVLRRTTLRAKPGGRVVARIGTRTEFGSYRILAVTARRGGWLKVMAPELENGEHAWIRAAATRAHSTDLELHVDRSDRELVVRRRGKVLRRVTIAVGRPDTPTPLGRFAVTDLLRSERADSPYGCCALALTGHQTKLLPGWPGGDRLAIHGTPNPETIGQAASLGCMRASARDMRMLLRRVPLGTPVIVRR